VAKETERQVKERKKERERIGSVSTLTIGATHAVWKNGIHFSAFRVVGISLV
jgi:hypothetical protein